MSTNPAEATHPARQAHECSLQGQYLEAAELYEQAIVAEPTIKTHYWYLGLALLLSEQESEAQATWMMGLMGGSPEQIEAWVAELAQILQAEAAQRESIRDYVTARLLRQHLQEIDPSNINNAIILLLLQIELSAYNPEDVNTLGVLPLLQSNQATEVNADLLVELLYKSLDPAIYHPVACELAAACLPYVDDVDELTGVLLQRAFDLDAIRQQASVAASLIELCLKLTPGNIDFLGSLATFYQNAREFVRGIETAKQYYSQVTTLPSRICANYLILRGLMLAGSYWEEAYTVLERQKTLLRSLDQTLLSEVQPSEIVRLSTSAFFLPYFNNDLPGNRALQNQVARTCLNSTQRERVEQGKKSQLHNFAHGFDAPKSTQRLRVGYLSHCLRRHSVGWLARSLFQYHDRNQIELYGYFISYNHYDPIQLWYSSQVEHAYKLGTAKISDAEKIAEQIYQDGIQILIDLDSITLDLSFDVMARKPAPVQATWLGWDASGLSTIDYFIADPYVLPDSAQDYYQEKIWRLPQTYIGLDGFEVATPTLRRDELGIPQDAVVYLSIQNGFKRNPSTARLQMQILKAVPHSYFLIKGVANEEAIQRSFLQIAIEMGVDCDRLRFLPEVSAEAIHRANLAIADVILDTYPYNGATTTLEALWMEVPMITRVGETFSSRNSYTMLKNVGITEGIAWTDQEYIEWGIRFGTDTALRQKVAWQLRTAKHTSPLWNGKQFAQTMEQAYEQMWETYLRAL